MRKAGNGLNTQCVEAVLILLVEIYLNKYDEDIITVRFSI